MSRTSLREGRLYKIKKAASFVSSGLREAIQINGIPLSIKSISSPFRDSDICLLLEMDFNDYRLASSFIREFGGRMVRSGHKRNSSLFRARGIVWETDLRDGLDMILRLDAILGSDKWISANIGINQDGYIAMEAIFENRQQALFLIDIFEQLEGRPSHLARVVRVQQSTFRGNTN